MIVSRQIEWDMGHRVMNHNSKCKNLHGHRYKMEICMKGKLIEKENDSSRGMVIDFGDIKSITLTFINDVLDHGFMVWEKDKLLTSFFKKNPEQKHITVPFTPTAENIASWIFKKLDPLFQDTYGTGLKLYSIKLWETPTCMVICKREDVFHENK